MASHSNCVQAFNLKLICYQNLFEKPNYVLKCYHIKLHPSTQDTTNLCHLLPKWVWENNICIAAAEVSSVALATAATTLVYPSAACCSHNLSLDPPTGCCLWGIWRLSIAFQLPFAYYFWSASAAIFTYNMRLLVCPYSWSADRQDIFRPMTGQFRKLELKGLYGTKLGFNWLILDRILCLSQYQRGIWLNKENQFHSFFEGPYICKV